MLNKYDFKYDNNHVAAMETGGRIFLTISSYGSMHLGGVNFIGIKKKIGERIRKGEIFAELESAKEVHELAMPFDGRIVEVNHDLLDDTFAISLDPYNTWIVAVMPDNYQDFQDMMDVSNYESQL